MPIELSLLVPHAPSLCHEDQVPDFQQNIIAGFKEVSKEITTTKSGCGCFGFLSLAFYFCPLCRL